jgi:NAD(P)-dependent dehydrogenase (short-subunit alcohol dehydrogenase family)
MTEPAGIAWPGSSPPACLVSGASGGLGRAIAERLARAGATVVITSRDRARAAVTATELAGAGDVRALRAGLDVADAGSVDAAARAVADLAGRLDVLVNNAAAYADWGETATGADLAASRAVMDVNLYGTWGMIQAFLPLLRRSEHPSMNGRIIPKDSSSSRSYLGFTPIGKSRRLYVSINAFTRPPTTRLRAMIASERSKSLRLLASRSQAC